MKVEGRRTKVATAKAGRLGGLALGVLLILAGAALGGYMSVPLPAELDLADRVVVGKVTNLVPEREEADGKMVWGRATIAVSETLKGKAADEAKVTVVMKLDLKYSMNMQSPPHVYHQGDEGIWVIMAGGELSHGYGLLKKERLDEVKAALKTLDARVWSEEVDGLRLWAGAAKDEGRPGGPGAVIVAVRNVSKEAIWVPRSRYKDVVRVVAWNTAKVERELSGAGLRSDVEKTVLCEELKPGETRYMHPDGENYGSFRIPEDLPAGKYSVTAILANRSDGEVHVDPTKRKPVDAWKGRILAPTFALEVPPKPPAKENEKEKDKDKEKEKEKEENPKTGQGAAK